METMFQLLYAMSLTACLIGGILWPYRFSTVPAYLFCVSLMFAAAYSAYSVGQDGWRDFDGKLIVAASMFARCGFLSLMTLVAGMLFRRVIHRGGRSFTIDRSYETRSRQRIDIRA
jgi:hypothetical protein